MQPENPPEYFTLDQFLAGNGFNCGFPAAAAGCDLGRSPFYDPMEAMEFGNHRKSDHHLQARVSAASENHKEAERKRRERINGHLDRLRALLLCNSKTDKASLLAKVVQRVRELKQETSRIIELDQTFPSEADEIAVLQNDDPSDGKSVVKASFCCDDRADLIPDLIEVLKTVPLSPLRAEMVTLGGRMRNVIVLAGDDKNQTDESALLLRDALKTLVLRSSYAAGQRSKRRRMLDEMIPGYD